MKYTVNIEIWDEEFWKQLARKIQHMTILGVYLFSRSFKIWEKLQGARRMKSLNANSKLIQEY